MSSRVVDGYAFRWSHDHGRYPLVIDGQVAERGEYAPTHDEPAGVLRFILNTVCIHQPAGDQRPVFGYGDQVTTMAAALGFHATETVPEFPWAIAAVVRRRHCPR